MFGFQVIDFHKLNFQGETMALRIGRSRLPELLNKRRLSQVEFARKLNVSEAYVSQLIAGVRKFSLLKAKQAAKILHCFIDELYEWEDDSG
jgi:transcriptional regulator with XRE-family HTH domain